MSSTCSINFKMHFPTSPSNYVILSPNHAVLIINSPYTFMHSDQSHSTSIDYVFTDLEVINFCRRPDFSINPNINHSPSFACNMIDETPKPINKTPKIQTRLVGTASLGITREDKTENTTGTDAKKPAVVASIPLDRRISGSQLFML